MMQGQVGRSGPSEGMDAKRDCQVPHSLGQLANSIERVHSSLDALEQRISPAMRPTPPEPGNLAKAEKVHEVKAMLAESIDGANAQVVRAEMRLHAILNRLEL